MASTCREGELKEKPRLGGRLGASPGTDRTQLLQNQTGHVLCTGQDGWWEAPPSEVRIEKSTSPLNQLGCIIPRAFLCRTLNKLGCLRTAAGTCVLACYFNVSQLLSLICQLPSLITLARCCTAKVALSVHQSSIFCLLGFFSSVKLEAGMGERRVLTWRKLRVERRLYPIS